MVCHHQLMLDPLLFEEFVQLTVVLCTIVGVDTFDLCPKLGVNQLPGLHEMVEHLLCIVTLERGKVHQASGVVDEETIIIVAADSRRMDLPTRVHMD